MTVKEQLRANFPKIIDKNDPVFATLIANEDGSAVMEYELNHLIEYMKAWTGTPDVYQQTGDMLEKSISFYSFLERFTDETEKSLKNRFGAIFIRNHDEVWGTPYDIKRVFEQYFPQGEIFLVENTNNIEENLIANGDFEEEGAWAEQGCSRSLDNSFSRSYGMSMPSGSILTQNVTLSDEGAYFLHFFYEGRIRIAVRDTNGNYWNPTTQAWGSSAEYTEFVSEEWEAGSMFFIAEETNVIIIVEGMRQLPSCIDYVRLYKKHPWASFTVIAHFTGEIGGNVLKLAPGDADPSQEINDYGLYDYFGHSYIAGMAAGFAQDVYLGLLELLRAQGVKADIEIVAKDF